MILTTIVWILGAIAAYRLWGNITWLAVLVAILAISYAVHPDEQKEYDAKGEYSTATATRLGWTFAIVAIIFVYSLFIK